MNTATPTQTAGISNTSFEQFLAQRNEPDWVMLTAKQLGKRRRDGLAVPTR
ncbi:MAG: hypothetical protein U0930_18125 [Pirellulales bacterium]